MSLYFKAQIESVATKKLIVCIAPAFPKKSEGTYYSAFRGSVVLSSSNSRYLVCATAPTVLCDLFLTLQVILSWFEDVHVVWI